MPAKNKEKTYEKIISMSNNNDYPTGNLLDFVYFTENYKLIALSFPNNNTDSRYSYSNYYVLVTSMF